MWASRATCSTRWCLDRAWRSARGYGWRAWGAVILTDRGMTDDKLVCSDHPVNLAERRKVLRFFHFYAKCKGLLNVWRRRPGRNACDGWCEAASALARAQPRDDSWRGPRVGF